MNAEIDGLFHDCIHDLHIMADIGTFDFVSRHLCASSYRYVSTPYAWTSTACKTCHPGSQWPT